MISAKPENTERLLVKTLPKLQYDSKLHVFNKAQGYQADGKYDASIKVFKEYLSTGQRSDYLIKSLDSIRRIVQKRSRNYHELAEAMEICATRMILPRSVRLNCQEIKRTMASYMPMKNKVFRPYGDTQFKTAKALIESAQRIGSGPLNGYHSSNKKKFANMYIALLLMNDYIARNQTAPTLPGAYLLSGVTADVLFPGEGSSYLNRFVSVFQEQTDNSHLFNQVKQTIGLVNERTGHSGEFQAVLRKIAGEKQDSTGNSEQ
jgi:hypothetical protein